MTPEELQDAIDEPNAQLILSWMAVNVETDAERTFAAGVLVAALKAARRAGARAYALRLAEHLDGLAGVCREVADECAAPAAEVEPSLARVCTACKAVIYSEPGKHRCGVTEYPPPEEPS